MGYDDLDHNFLLVVRLLLTGFVNLNNFKIKSPVWTLNAFVLTKKVGWIGI